MELPSNCNQINFNFLPFSSEKPQTILPPPTTQTPTIPDTAAKKLSQSQPAQTDFDRFQPTLTGH